MSTGPSNDSDPEALGSIAFFQGMSEAELKRVDDLGVRMDAPDGEVLVDQGDPGTHCFVVLDGTANVYANGEYVATSGQGSTIGEMALVDHRPRTATVVAAGPMTLLRFDTRQFKALLEEMPKAHERIMGILSARLRDHPLS
ncbi:MAG: Crp/Fnr family transcriptional regulator [Microthrixaceae bacterium]